MVKFISLTVFLLIIWIVISCPAGPSSCLVVRGVVIIVVLHLGNWVGVLVVAVDRVLIYVWYVSVSLTCLSSFEDAEGKEEDQGEKKSRTSCSCNCSNVIVPFFL